MAGRTNTGINHFTIQAAIKRNFGLRSSLACSLLDGRSKFPDRATLRKAGFNSVEGLGESLRADNAGLSKGMGSFAISLMSLIASFIHSTLVLAHSMNEVVRWPPRSRKLVTTFNPSCFAPHLYCESHFRVAAQKGKT